jgi:YD repeat-containing protein
MTKDIIRFFLTALAFLSFGNAAAVPSYIGPFSYQPDSGGWYGSEDEAARGWEQYNYTFPQICLYQVRPAAGAIWSQDGGGNEGVSIRETKPYEINRGDRLPDGSCAVQGWGGVPGKLMYRQRTVCGSNQRYFDNKCVNVSPIEFPGVKGANQGPTCAASGTHSCGEPINSMTGNMWHVENDYEDRPGSLLSLKRTYNSQSWETVRPNMFGTRWTVPYDAKLTAVAASQTFRSQKCYQRQDNYAIFCEGNSVDTPLSTATTIEVFRGNGKNFTFNVTATGYQGDKDTNDQLLALRAGDNSLIGFTYKDAQSGNSETYDLNGRLLSIVSKSGVLYRLTYSDGISNAVGRYPADAPYCFVTQPGDTLPLGRLMCVSDAWGRQIAFEYDQKGRVTKFYNPAGQMFSYEYDGPTGGCIPANASTNACKANNLTKITYPTNSSKQYVYNEASNINWGSACDTPSIGNGFGPFLYTLTGLVDELGTRYISWFYNCRGQAKVSTHPNRVDEINIGFYQSSYGVASYSQVIPTTGLPSAPSQVTATFTPALILDVYKNSGIDVPCAVCGPIKSRTFDINGNVATETDFNGNVTKYTYDLTRNLEISRTEASGTTNARTITTAWHPTLRLPLTIAQPKLVTKFTYDDVGQVLTRAEQATNDVTGASGTTAAVIGAPRVWTYTYNAYGQILTAVGPRTVDSTTYDYDAAGNLASVTNALGQVTLYSNYDSNGHVGRVTEPNGLVTDFTYTARGRIATHTVSDGATQETTSYEYDPAGQLSKQTNPDGTWVAFAYDPAHRLIGMNDNLGNKIAYTLDLTGNRTQEQVTDPNGVLGRKVARVFNNLNQMTQITGAAQ